MTAFEVGDYSEYVSKLVYSDDRAAWRADTRRLGLLFRRDLKKHLGITDHPKADLLVEMAWSTGLHAGFYQVVADAEELVQLLDVAS